MEVVKAWSGASDAEVVAAPGAVEGGCGRRGRNIRRAVLWQLVVAQEAPYGMCQVVVAPQREQGSATRSGSGGFGVDRVNTPSFGGFVDSGEHSLFPRGLSGARTRGAARRKLFGWRRCGAGRQASIETLEQSYQGCHGAR